VKVFPAGRAHKASLGITFVSFKNKGASRGQRQGIGLFHLNGLYAPAGIRVRSGFSFAFCAQCCCSAFRRLSRPPLRPPHAAFCYGWSNQPGAPSFGGAPPFVAFAKGGIPHRQPNRMPFRAPNHHCRRSLAQSPHPSPGGAGIYACGKTALSLRLQPLRWLREPSIKPAT
jgi:hypothetical protein